MAINLKGLASVVQNQDLIIKPRFEPWLIANSPLPPVPKHIADRIYELLVTPQRNRVASFSASGSGKCERAQIYGFLGVPTYETIDSKLAMIFANGTWGHLRLQTLMLMARVIEDVEHIEFGLTWQRMQAKGTMDGIGFVPDDHPHISWRGKTFGLELKTANSNVYKPMLHDGPDKYKRQFTRYFLMSGVDLFVVYVENKDTNESFEWVVEPDLAMMKEDRAELSRLNRALRTKQLPPRIPECEKLSGEKFRFCSYGGKHGPCALRTTFSSAQDAADEFLVEKNL